MLHAPVWDLNFYIGCPSTWRILMFVEVAILESVRVLSRKITGALSDQRSSPTKKLQNVNLITLHSELGFSQLTTKQYSTVQTEVADFHLQVSHPGVL